MRLKGLLLSVMTLLLLILPFGTSQANAITFEEARQLANQEIERDFGCPDYFETKNVQAKYLNEDTWKGRLVFAYGQPYQFHPDTGFHRFLGYSMGGTPFTNIHFPIEVWGRNYLEDYNWIEEPRRNIRVQDKVKSEGGTIKQNYFNNQSILRESMRAGLEQQRNPNDPSKSILRGDNVAWEKYVHVYSPPTYTTWGMGRMWNIGSDGGLYYKTVPMAPYAPADGPDFSVKFAQAQFERKPGEAVESTVTFTLAADHPKPELAKLSLAHNVPSGTAYLMPLEPVDPADALAPGGEIEFAPGESKAYRYRATAQDTSTVLIVKITPDKDRNWSNNTDEAEINVTAPPAPVIPPASGELTFQAVSRSGKMRVPNTARWTDTVTATLRPAAPTAPRGEITSWRIDWAKLTYPKTHPDFVFGSPVEPWGTLTVNMTAGGHTSKVDFLQNWSVNGAPIYDRLKGQMVPGPTNYNIKADYKISYSYRYKVWYRTGPPEARTWNWRWERSSGSYTKSVTAPLLVDGAGTIGLGA